VHYINSNPLQCHSGRRLLRTRQGHSQRKGKNQETDNPISTLATSEAGDAYYFAPGHDGWVVGDETVIAYEIVGAGKDFGPWKSVE